MQKGMRVKPTSVTTALDEELLFLIAIYLNRNKAIGIGIQVGSECLKGFDNLLNLVICFKQKKSLNHSQLKGLYITKRKR